MTALRLRTGEVDALTHDGRIVRLRDINAADEKELCSLHARLKDQSLYQRFFIANHEYAQRYARTLARPNDDAHHAVGAFSGEHLVGVAEYDVVSENTAEFALVVADSWHDAGLGTLLLEQLIGEARDAGISHLVALVLSCNPAMFALLRQLRFDVVSSHQGPETQVQLAL